MNKFQDRQNETARRLAQKGRAAEAARAEVAAQRSFDHFDQTINPAEVYALFDPADVQLTRRQIAALIGRSKSPSLLRVLKSLVNEGYLNFRFVALPNGVDMYLYERNTEGKNA